MARRSKTPAAAPAASPAAPPLALPAELTIYTVGGLHPLWLAWLGQCAAVEAGDAASSAEVQAAAVDQVDGAGLQLLLALQRSLSAQGRRLAIAAPSDALSQGCDNLGLGDWLRERTAEPAEAAA